MIFFNSIGDAAIVQLLHQKGANLFLQDNDGNTALHKAAQNKHHHIIKLLLSLTNETTRLENIQNNKGLKANDIFEY